MEIGDPRMKAQIGFLPEHPYFYDYLTAHELLDYYARLSGVPAQERKRRIDVALDRVKLHDVNKVQLRKFSKGMLQRVGIAQAIIHDPKLIFLDEPMSGLDPIGRREVRDLMQELKDQGKTIFFSTHILSDAETICDRVAVLNKGELKGVGVVADLTDKLTGTVEFQFEGAAAVDALRALGATVHATGESVRAQLPEAMQDAAIDTLRRHKARLLSITPVRATLEDYFLGKLDALQPQENFEVAEAGR
jgi:ABC-2 type transport system ATP-binding protein